MRLCDVDGCDRPHQARGLCDAHYKRWNATGRIGGYIRPRRSTWEHGTVSGYRSRGCRCNLCTEANRLYAEANATGDLWDTTTVVTRDDIDPDELRCLACGLSTPYQLVNDFITHLEEHGR